MLITRSALALVLTATAAPALAQSNPKAVPENLDDRPPPIRSPEDPPDGPAFDLSWYTIDGGGSTYMTGGTFQLGATAGQPDAGEMSGGAFSVGGGFWYGIGSGNTCYPNCDQSTGNPLLTANDLTCFINAYAAGAVYANCDGSTGTPILTANDFTCFINAYAFGCT